MEAMRAAVEGVSSGLLSTAEPGAPPVVIATEEFSISAKLVSEITEVGPFPYPYPYPYPYPHPHPYPHPYPYPYPYP
jgi:hypothetical protein